jgi:hypothetical protein
VENRTLGAGGTAAASGKVRKTCSTSFCTSRAVRVKLCVRHGAFGVCSAVRCHTKAIDVGGLCGKQGKRKVFGPRVCHQRTEEGGAPPQARWGDTEGCVRPSRLHHQSRRTERLRQARWEHTTGVHAYRLPHQSTTTRALHQARWQRIVPRTGVPHQRSSWCGWTLLQAWRWDCEQTSRLHHPLPSTRSLQQTRWGYPGSVHPARLHHPRRQARPLQEALCVCGLPSTRLQEQRHQQDWTLP